MDESSRPERAIGRCPPRGASYRPSVITRPALRLAKLPAISSPRTWPTNVVETMQSQSGETYGSRAFSTTSACTATKSMGKCCGLRHDAAPRRVVREPAPVTVRFAWPVFQTGQVLHQAPSLGEALPLEPSALRVVHVPAPFGISARRLTGGSRHSHSALSPVRPRGGESAAAAHSGDA